MIECMFEDVRARFGEEVERRYPSSTTESVAVVERIRAQHRAQRIATERRDNRTARQTPPLHPQPCHTGARDALADEEPPPF